MQDNKITKGDISRLAETTKLSLSAEEKTKLQSQLAEAMTSVEVLNELDTSNVEQLAHPTNLSNVTRNDEVKPSLSQKEALSNSKNTHNGYFVTEAALNE